MKLFFPHGPKGPHVPAEDFVGTLSETNTSPGPEGPQVPAEGFVGTLSETIFPPVPKGLSLASRRQELEESAF